MHVISTGIFKDKSLSESRVLEEAYIKLEAEVTFASAAFAWKFKP